MKEPQPTGGAGPIPASTDIVVIGGGPAGSATAVHLRRKGYDVVVLEKARFPRPQVGESLIPHVWKYFDQLGVADKVQAAGFVIKSGGIVIWDGKIRQIKFTDFGFTRPGLHVERDLLDDILLGHAESCGTRVFQEISVRSADLGRPDGHRVLYEDRRGSTPISGEIRARYIVDASGMGSVIAGGTSARRRVGTDGKYIGMWGYFKNSDFLGADRQVHAMAEVHQARPVTLVTSYKDGWVWHIVLRDMTSVGLVMNTAVAKEMTGKDREQYFIDTCRGLPYVGELLAHAEYIPESLTFRPDYSYYSENICGKGYVCVGDAAAFVDPIFSQGVVFALYGGGLAAWTIDASLRHPERAVFYNRIYADRLKQYYGFARLLAFGDFGGEGVSGDAVRHLVLAMPKHELELSLAASGAVGRSDNLRRMLAEAGVSCAYDESYLTDRAETLAGLTLDPGIPYEPPR